MVKHNEMAALAKQAHQGDAESMFQLAIRAYWEYDQEPGLEWNQPIFNLLIAAGQHGDGAMNRKIGDFFRNEFQEDLAQTHYLAALEKDLELAAKGDAAAQYAVSEQYAIGLGVEQDDAKAAFWLQQAARSGHKEAREMMVNLWQDGAALPVSSLMAGKWDSCGRSLPQDDQNAQALRQAAVRKETAADRLDIAKRLGQKKRNFIRVTDLARAPIAQLRNAASSLIGTLLAAGFFGITCASYISMLITIFTGYRESGLFHLINQITYFCLNMPLRILLAPKGGATFQNTVEYLCDFFYCDGSFFGAIVSFAFYAIVLAIWSFVLYLVIGLLSVVIEKLLKCHGIKLTIHDPIQNQAQISKLETELAAADRELSVLLHSYGIPSGMDSGAALLGLCDYAAFLGLCLPDAVTGYRAMLEQDEKPTINIRVSGSKSYWVLYFVMNWMIPGSSVYAGICSDPKYNFDPVGTFMDGYHTYRRGKDFKGAEESFREVLKTKPNTPEAGFAAWNLSQICSYEHLSVFAWEGKRDEHNKKCMEEAESMLKLAAQYGCPYARTDGVSGCIQLWQGRYNAMMFLAEHYSDDPTLQNYFTAMAEADRKRIGECGNPLDEAQWNGYDTGCIWAIYKEVLPECSKAGWESELKEAQKKLNSIKNRGIYQIDELAGDIDYKLDNLNMLRQLEQARNEARSRDDFLRRQAWEEQRDEYERQRNMVLSFDPRTDLERNLTGDLSDSGLLYSELRRSEARDKFLKDLDKD